MNSRKRVVIRRGKILATILSVVISPVLLILTLIGALCDYLLFWWSRFRHWICIKLDGNSEKHVARKKITGPGAAEQTPIQEKNETHS